jgi:hypothetical protein
MKRKEVSGRQEWTPTITTAHPVFMHFEFCTRCMYYFVNQSLEQLRFSLCVCVCVCVCVCEMLALGQSTNSDSEGHGAE